MSQINRDTFVTQFASGIDIYNMDAETVMALTRAGVDIDKLAGLADQDGIIGSPDQLEELFALIDDVDRNGSYDSIKTTKRTVTGEEVSTRSGAAYDALVSEIQDHRDKARLAPRSSEARTAAATELPKEFGVRDGDAPWFKVAAGERGIQELSGSRANSRILEYFDSTWQRHDDDSGKKNAWCAAFVTWSLTQENVENDKAVGARGYENFGEPSEPFRGAIAVIQTGSQKHVAFIAGVNERGELAFLGGNQNNEVSVVTNRNAQVIAIRKPAGYEIPPEQRQLPVLDVPDSSETR